MRKDFLTTATTLGCWDGNTQSIVLARETLKSNSIYCGTLLHELLHAKTGFCDVTRDFESSLTSCLGTVCEMLISSQIETKAMKSKINDLNKQLEFARKSAQPTQPTQQPTNAKKPLSKPWYKFW